RSSKGLCTHYISLESAFPTPTCLCGFLSLAPIHCGKKLVGTHKPLDQANTIAMSGLFNRMRRAVRLAASQAWGFVTGVTDPVIQACRSRWPWSWKKTLLSLFGLGSGVAGLVLLGPHILTVLGFASTGILAFSLAASIQSFFFGAYTTNPFSFFQSLGARAAAPAAGAAVAGSFLLVASAVAFYFALNMS
ncbi:hypothetical protein BKA70DRAFT_1301271, partial [Coprinopsis sp. MPI-PUGE-AT-0042]